MTKSVQDTEPTPRGRHLVAKSSIAVLTLGALGVVFGDIGTSPLYAVQTIFSSDKPYRHS